MRTKRIVSVLLLFSLILWGLPVFSGAADIVAHGIDVSSYQGTVDWRAVKAAGVDFVILRAGTSRGKDAKFEENYSAAKAAGLDVGCYFYTYATTPEQVTEEANQMLGWLADKQLEYPVYLDIEDTAQQELTNTERTILCLTFLNRMREEDWYGGVYSYKYWFENLMDLGTLTTQGEIWWAHWPASGQPDIDYSRYGLWQYASDGRVDGIDGDVDVDVAYVDYPTLMRRNGWNGYPPAMPDGATSGDVNGDGRVNTVDARLTLQYAAGRIGADALDLTEADVNEDGKVNTVDARLILQWAAGRISAFPKHT